MNLAIAIHAVNGRAARRVAEACTRYADTSSLETLRAWLGAHRINIASMLAEDDAYATVMVTRGRGDVVGCFYIDRRWPHTIEASTLRA